MRQAKEFLYRVAVKSKLFDASCASLLFWRHIVQFALYGGIGPKLSIQVIARSIEGRIDQI